MSTIRQRSGIFFALESAADELAKGIGMKKRLAKAAHGGQSPFTHSWSTFRRYLGVAKEFVQYCKAKGVNKIFKINEDVVLGFFKERKIAFGLTEKTIKLNLCAIKKFLRAIGRSDLVDILEVRFSEVYSKGAASGRTEYFSNPLKVIQCLKDDAHKRIAELQLLTGARIGDVKKIQTNTLFKQVIIIGSKGGRDRVLDFSDREGVFERIDRLCQELKVDINQRGWENLRKGYYVDLRHSVQKCGEIYTGAHAFRANYAHDRREELIDRGLSEKEADKIVSEELGHSRPAMGRYYSM